LKAFLCLLGFADVFRAMFSITIVITRVVPQISYKNNVILLALRI